MPYLDNAATSWPKPEEVYLASDRALRECGNPGRSGHRLSLRAGALIRETRLLAAQLFNADDPDRIVFTPNATAGINLALKGLLSAGDHVVCGALEHNAVARPLEALKGKGVTVTKVGGPPRSGISAAAIGEAIQENTKLVVIAHASNVTGTINPIEEIGKLCEERRIYFLIDAAQTAGTQMIDVRKMRIDLLAFPGHKGLLGPQGTGGLYITPDIDLEPLFEGGTGSDSLSLTQPAFSPDRYESGTLNTPGIAGLGAGIRFIMKEGLEVIRNKERDITDRLIHGLHSISGITVFGPPVGSDRAAVVSIVIQGVDSTDAAVILDQSFDIAVRAGLHCAPDAHRLLGTLETGTIRISPGCFTSESDIDFCVDAIARIARSV